jgi:hypothetical protein
MAPDTPISRDALLAQLSAPLEDVRVRRLRSAGFSLAEACTLAANPYLSWAAISFAATLLEGGLASPLEAMRAVWPRGKERP